ncbi:hypothetical protein BTURTLESOX_1174 [bacterium endosymbiont of Bathymodiolus sp. 5 South]|nr:hypothetical protein BTURTLESOX_1174 [bacterium endosymbiont of Bathymodiolus sp. 5 South]
MAVFHKIVKLVKNGVFDDYSYFMQKSRIIRDINLISIP